jgi:hypothetical protein
MAEGLSIRTDRIFDSFFSRNITLQLNGNDFAIQLSFIHVD